MNKQKSEYRMGVGASSVLMVLVVLVLTALGLLSFSSAKNAQSLTRRNLVMTQAYYDATAEVQQKLAALDEWLLEKQQDPTSNPAGVEGVSLTESNGESAFSFSVDAGFDRTLEVAGLITQAGGGRYQITRHELTTSHSGEWETEYYELFGDE